ncbi:hypothetical protein RB195_000192 [Necator americanus]|uniref:7TM GPCR serpentine receptor class x (Srx) domain-containing protein n=1 Tax=Necator americanus TaxID=51031 RepID=A0ABR1D8F4_NECAM
MEISSTCAGVLMIVVDFIGLVPLLLVVLQILYYRRRFTPFRCLILSKLMADGLELFIVMMVLVPSELIFGEWVPQRYRPAVGYFAIGLQYSSFQTSIAMTANRLLVVLYPLKYNATINSALYLSMLGLFCIADYLDDDTIKFFLTVIGWQLWLGATPYCIIALQKEFQQPIRKLWRKIARRSEISGFQLTTEVISKFPTRHH